MSNLHDLEQRIIERKREIDERLGHEALISQLHAAPRVTGGSRRLPIRARFGLFLIHLGARLAT